MSHELSVLGLGVTSTQLEEVAEARTAVLDVRCVITSPCLATCKAPSSVISPLTIQPAESGTSGKPIYFASATERFGSARLQVLGEMLSQHILQNYASFVKGIDSVSSIEEELRTALETVAAGRSTLSQLKNLSSTDVCIAQGALRKRKIASVLDALQKLQAVRELPAVLRQAYYADASNCACAEMHTEAQQARPAC